ncbi:MAG: twin-arginine translocase TatA/TatE family subunit [Erysipelotrichaceae bacterium]|nr:twin-arginine translocase TatA/TatE family subunit [Erysipelotrichaceae bacterium]MDY5251151.1 twin-arginine translocase TatA/TatE family subunit [Erysipelotrichaceae bacterium]
MFGRLGMSELVVILVIILLVFGPTKLPALAKSMGQALKEFKKGTQDLQDDIQKTIDDVTKEDTEKK